MTATRDFRAIGQISSNFLESVLHQRTSGDANQPYLDYLQQQMKQHGVHIGLRGPDKRPVNQTPAT